MIHISYTAINQLKAPNFSGNGALQEASPAKMATPNAGPQKRITGNIRE